MVHGHTSVTYATGDSANRPTSRTIFFFIQVGKCYVRLTAWLITLMCWKIWLTKRWREKVSQCISRSKWQEYADIELIVFLKSASLCEIKILYHFDLFVIYPDTYYTRTYLLMFLIYFPLQWLWYNSLQCALLVDHRNIKCI